MELEQSEGLSQSLVFNTHIYHIGTAIYVKTPQGDRFNAIISDSGYEYIQCFRVGVAGDPINIEIELEDYLNGVWEIKRLL